MKGDCLTLLSWGISLLLLALSDLVNRVKPDVKHSEKSQWWHEQIFFFASYNVCMCWCNEDLTQPTYWVHLTEKNPKNPKTSHLWKAAGSQYEKETCSNGKALAKKLLGGVRSPQAAEPTQAPMSLSPWLFLGRTTSEGHVSPCPNRTDPPHHAAERPILQKRCAPAGKVLQRWVFQGLELCWGTAKKKKKNTPDFSAWKRWMPPKRSDEPTSWCQPPVAVGPVYPPHTFLHPASTTARALPCRVRFSALLSLWLKHLARRLGTKIRGATKLPPCESGQGGGLWLKRYLRPQTLHAESRPPRFLLLPPGAESRGRGAVQATRNAAEKSRCWAAWLQGWAGHPRRSCSSTLQHGPRQKPRWSPTTSDISLGTAAGGDAGLLGSRLAGRVTGRTSAVPQQNSRCNHCLALGWGKQGGWYPRERCWAVLGPSHRASKHYVLTSALNVEFKLGYFLSVSSKKSRQNIPAGWDCIFLPWVTSCKWHCCY